MQKVKRILSLFLCLVLLLSMTPYAAADDMTGTVIEEPQQYEEAQEAEELQEVEETQEAEEPQETEEPQVTEEPQATEEPQETEEPKVVSSVEIRLPDNANTMKPGDTAVIEAAILPEDAEDKTLEFVSSDESILTVSAEGIVTAIKEGSAYIIAYAADGAVESNRLDITVASDNKPVESITITDTLLTVIVEKQLQLKAEVLPEDASDKTVKWSSSDEKIATIDENGVVTGVAEGEVVITAAANDESGVSAEVTVTVEKPSSRVPARKTIPTRSAPGKS